MPTEEKKTEEVVAPEMVENFEYKIVGESKDPMLSIIEKSGLKTRFTLLDIKQGKEKTERVRKEIAAQHKLQEAKIANIVDHHPIVKDLSPEDVFAIHMFYDAKVMLEACENKLKEIDQLFVDYAKEEEEMARQIGIAIPKEALNDEKPLEEASAAVNL